MFEFHGWARVESTTGRTEWRADGLHLPDDEELYLRLQHQLDSVDEMSRECVGLRCTINGLTSLTVSGLRNHRDETIFQLFEWLAENAKRSTGVLFTRDDEDGDRQYNHETHFRVFRLCNGVFAEQEALFPMPSCPEPRPPAEWAEDFKDFQVRPDNDS